MRLCVFNGREHAVCWITFYHFLRLAHCCVSELPLCGRLQTSLCRDRVSLRSILSPTYFFLPPCPNRIHCPEDPYLGPFFGLWKEFIRSSWVKGLCAAVFVPAGLGSKPSVFERQGLPELGTFKTLVGPGTQGLGGPEKLIPAPPGWQSETDALVRSRHQIPMNLEVAQTE